VIGFIGVLIVTNPGAETFQMGALYALANAILFGTVTAGVRGMTTTESAETLTVYQLIMLSVAFGATLPFAFVMPNGLDWLWLALNGVGNGIAQYWWTRAIHMAPTAAVVPFNYLNLVWAAMLGFAIWGDVPTIGLVIGSAIVVGSGLFLLWSETRKKARAASPE
jgi:drug/metabolite transporter (DMT)-like permease